MTTTPVKRALISVSDKTNIVEFAKKLVALQIEIISTGGTSELLKKAGVPHLEISELTGFPEMLEGRVKTLHPKVHGGILAKRDQHAMDAQKHGIQWIDLVVVNFYPFEKATSQENLTCDQAIEYIDIGGPTLVRAASKNFAWVGVVTDPKDYSLVLNELEQQKGLSLTFKQQLAAKVFALTAHYDAMIYAYFLKQSAEKSELRYGENPHQKAHAYKLNETGLLSASLHQGKALSYNNLLDAEAALLCVSEFVAPACVIVKHANPCGAALRETIELSYEAALAADPLSAFGGIVALNRPCTKELATMITQTFMEVVLAPHYSEEALAVFKVKPNLRVLALPSVSTSDWEMRFITGGILIQERDTQILSEENLTCVTNVKPSAKEIASMLFAWPILKHIKSNAILIAKDQQTVGIGAGQVSRIDAVDLAIRKGGEYIEGAILASDAFFPFRDSIDRIAKTGIRAIIQPGGSMRDEEVIAACNEHKIAMVFTHRRCFKH